jgi:solute carrier family 23 (nucleobase transporter), member 1
VANFCLPCCQICQHCNNKPTGGSFAYLPPTFAIIANPALQAIEDPAERFEQTLQTISGSVLIVGIVQIVLGYSGAIVPILKYISPVTIAPVITAIGLGFYGVGFNSVATCFPMGLTQMFLSILFSQYMKRIKIGGYPIFGLFPIILAIAITWSLSAILTATDTFEVGSQLAACRTDGTSELVDEMPWFRVPYPGQWNGYQFRVFGKTFVSIRFDKCDKEY